MKNFPQFLNLALSCIVTFTLAAQPEIKAAQQIVDAQQKEFRFFLDKITIDDNIKKQLQQFSGKETDGIQNNLAHLATAPVSKRAKGIRSLSFFMKETSRQLEDRKFNIYKLPDIVKKYRQTLTALMNNQSFEKNFKGIGWRSSQLLANSFWEFDEKKQMADISAYKRVVKTPDYIFSFLETKPGFYYTDSLIIFMATQYPEQFLTYIKKNNNTVTAIIAKQKNIYVQQLLSFSSNNLASELAPFTEQVVNKQLTVDEIVEKRKDVTAFYQLLVNTVMENEVKQSNGDEVLFQKALRNALYQRSLDFYVKKINDMHSSPDAARFQVIQNLRPQDIYYIIVSADEEMYTSTYLGLYKRLLAHFKDQQADAVLNLVHKDKFKKFMRVAATYNTLTDFLHLMPADKSKELIRLFVSDIEDDDEDEAVADATDIADAFITFSKDPEFNNEVKEELMAGLKRSNQHNLYQSTRLYTILLQVYDLVDNNNAQNSLSANYKAIPLSYLKGKDGAITELVVFYGDEDGKSSYNSFLNLFKDKTQWNVTTNDSWVTINSLQGQPINIYANLPLKSEDEKDIAAQQALIDYLNSKSIEPSILIHRGHSYHLPNTLKYLQPTMKLAILGSCGGYKNMKKIMDINPDLHIIASKQVGSMAVNDPLLRQLNNDLAESKNIDWINFWNEMNTVFKNDLAVSKLFEEYVPPYKNVSSFVVKLYNYNEDDMQGTK
jgi:hypothetical protein